jgi:hypothetical protein
MQSVFPFGSPCPSCTLVGFRMMTLNTDSGVQGHKKRVSFRSEVETYGLRLCLSDMSRNDFMKDRWGRIVALDFGSSCFLPPSFFNFALRQYDDFPQLLARLIKPPKSTQLDEMLTAHYSLIPYGTDKIGEHISLLSCSFLPLVPLQRD